MKVGDLVQMRARNGVDLGKLFSSGLVLQLGNTMTLALWNDGTTRWARQSDLTGLQSCSDGDLGVKVCGLARREAPLEKE